MMLLHAKEANMTQENQAALDDNMPPSEEVLPEVAEVAEVVEEVTATSDTEVSSESQVVEIDEKQKALNKLAFEKREEKRQRVAAEEEVARLKAQIPQQATQVEEAPTLEGFDFDEQAFNAANIKYQVRQAKQEIASEQQEHQELQRQQTTQANFNAKVTKLSETTIDYAETVGQLPELPSETLDAIMQSDNGPQLAYYLGKHLDVADQIASASPMQAAMQLGQISSQLLSAKPEIKPSAAPDPIKPVDSSGSVSKSMDDMSMEEIMNL